jgi:hypothetical protein
MAREREQATSEKQSLTTRNRIAGASRRLTPVLLAVAFWSAILLPWIVIGLLYTGFAMDEPGLFTGLVILNLVSAIVGGKYQHNL